MKRPHFTLRPRINIALILVWGLATTLLFLNSSPRPFVMVVAGAVLGLLSGMMQTRGIQEAKGSILDADSMLAVRKRLKTTKWGRRYLYFLWGGSIVLVILSLPYKTNPIFSFLVGYFTLMFIRDIVTLRSTFELDTLRYAKHEDSA